MSLKIFAYNQGSESAARLAEALDVWMIRHRGSSYRPRHGDVVINWGKGRDWSPARTINSPNAVARAINKRTALQAFAGRSVSVPEFTTVRSVAQSWADGDSKVVCRHILDGHEGAGIEIINGGGRVPEAPLYTKYIPKDREYRIHVLGGQVIDKVRKVLRADAPEGSSRLVRNTANGYVFARHEGPERSPISVPPPVEHHSLAAIQALGLDFGAVDVIYNARRNRAYVLEVNTAPGIEGSTVEFYANGFRRLLSR